MGNFFRSGNNESRKEYLAIGAIFLVFMTLFICYFSKLGHPIVECGREAFIPYRIMQGEVLFKDILCIYGAFSYYFSALCYVIFEANLNVLYLIGATLALGVVYGVYFISREFLNRTLSASLAFFVMCVCAFSTGISNYIFPYSYAEMWALLGFLYALLFLIKYIKNPCEKFAALSVLFWGLSVVNKGDYFSFIIPLMLTFCYYRPLKNLKPLLYVFIFPLLTALALMINGVDLFDITSMLELVSKMSAATGIYFEPRMLIKMFTIALKNIPVFLILIYLVVLSRNIEYKFFRILAISALFFLMSLYVFQTLELINSEFAFFPVLVFLITLYSFIKFSKDKTQAPYLILLLSACLASTKNFLFFSLGAHGTYAMAILVVALTVSLYRLISEKIHSEKYVTLSISLLLGAYTLMCFFLNFWEFKNVIKYPIKTDMGKIETTKNTANDVCELIDFIFKYTEKYDKVAILPEGQMINFLTRRDSGVIYDRLMPSYFQAFGEDKISADFERVMPKYIVLSNQDTSEYDKYEVGQICINYGLKFCSFINKNYENEAILGSGVKFFVFTKNENEKRKMEVINEK